MTKFAEVAISLPIDKLFQYSIPEELSDNVRIGSRVFVPFGPRTMVGYVVGLNDAAEVRGIKGIRSVIDKEPILTDELLKLTKWIGENYFCSWGEAIGAVIPGGIKKGKESIGSRIKVPEMTAEDFTITDPHVLVEEQEKALAEIVECVDKGASRTFLLHGITSSGKTEVYLQAIDAVLKLGKQAIMLVPEIALTPQTIERFISRFGHRVAVTHSHMTPAKRYLEWKKIKDGKADIVVGARSAVFAPMSRLGLIIIDEEHETTYKQDDVPRYHARDVAEERSKLNKCPLILGSATPSLESYYRAKQGIYKLIRLTKRIDDRLLPRVKIVDMRMDLATRKKIAIFSRVMLDAVDNALKAGKQVIIFLNRRGFSTFINCKKCGLVVKCRRCDAVMVYHFEEKKLVCHYCGYHQAPPDICPKCHSGYIRYSGLGTEKVESELSRAFSHVKMARMDSDTTAKKGSHDRILSRFKSGEVKMLVGTQMIAKGLDFPQVTLVGVVSADVTLNIPDFRSSERTFNLLTQVGGRAGRGEDGGEVIIQTYAPGHYAILAAAKHDYEKFYEEEIISRKELHFPPFVSLIKIVVRARNEEIARQTAAEMVETMRAEDKDAMIAGPAPAPMARMRGYYRYNILLKGKDKVPMCALLKKVLGNFRKPHGVLIAVDVDPISM
ncbi:MAG: primosomal protein N' [Candidatus Omnitrophota bacterium]